MFGGACSGNRTQEEGSGDKAFPQTVKPLLTAFPGGDLSLGSLFVVCLSIQAFLI